MKNTEGSVLLVVILFTSLLSVFCLSFWYSSTLLYDISLKRLEYEQKYRAAQGGLHYAIVVCKKNFDAILQYSTKSNQLYQLETPLWKISKHISYRCDIHITPLNNMLQITSMLFDNNQKKVFTLSCCLQKKHNLSGNGKEKFFIKNWNVNEI